MMNKIIYKFVENNQELELAFKIRRNVFVEEQGINSELVFDGDNDIKVKNIIVRNNKIALGAARIRFIGNSTAKLERMAVEADFRHSGIGKGIIKYIIKHLHDNHVNILMLHAQKPVVSFYKACGFRESGLPFFEVGIEHTKMEMDLQ
jgi:predicted GNAT family N-acyltransferase